MQVIRHDIVLVGGGGAGLRAAIAAVESDPDLTIACVSKVYPMRSHTVSAEGGSAAVAREDDNFDLHAYDTIKGSDFLADQDIVEMFVREAPLELTRLEHWGCPWSRDEDGRVAVRAFGGMSVKRTWFASDKTGFHMLHSLFQTSLKYDRIVRIDEAFATRLLVEGGRARGVVALDVRSGEVLVVLGRAVVICTGGGGQVFPFTTNASIKTGDGMVLAYRAGVPLKDMEFVQYHPTGLPGTGILITEASRGEGGYLKNAAGERFLERYVPNKMELGPRDILSRAIIQEFHEGRGFKGTYGEYVHLDLTHLGEEKIDQRLPFVRELAINYVGIDPVREPIPVRPVVHYMMGGIDTDATGATELPGLYAAGECASVSINGANRLGSNSLTECLVFGARAGASAASFIHEVEQGNEKAVLEEARHEESRIDSLRNKPGGERITSIRRELRTAMERGCGVFREERELESTLASVLELKRRFADIGLQDGSKVFNTEIVQALELASLLDIGEAVVFAALDRKESRGAHTRTDHPARDDQNFLKHSLIRFAPDGPKLEYNAVTITRWQPEERKY